VAPSSTIAAGAARFPNGRVSGNALPNFSGPNFSGPAGAVPENRPAASGATASPDTMTLTAPNKACGVFVAPAMKKSYQSFFFVGKKVIIFYQLIIHRVSPRSTSHAKAEISAA
jgi:hypothetical protein